MDHASLALKLRLLRARKGITLVEAAELTGVTRETLGELERGKRRAYTPTLAKIAQGYGVPVEELVEEEAPVPLAEAPEAGREVVGGAHNLTVAEAGAVEMLRGFCRFLEDAPVNKESLPVLLYMVRLAATMGLPLMEREELRDLMAPLAFRLAERTQKLRAAAKELHAEPIEESAAPDNVIKAAKRFALAG